MRLRLASLIALLLALPALRAADPVVLAPAEEIGLVEDFGADRQDLWKPRMGDNVRATVQAGYELPGVAGTLLRVHPVKQDPNEREAGKNWFVIARSDLPAGLVPAGTDGLRFLLGSHDETKWWLQVELTLAGGQRYSKVISDASFPAGRMVEINVPLGEFRSGEQALTPELATGLRGIALIMSTPGSALYIDRISAWRQEKLTGWLEMTSSQPTHNVFERSERVGLTFTVGGTPPASARGFRWARRDWRDQPAGGGTLALGAERTFTVDATPPEHGYYEVTAYWTDAAGKDLEQRSCLRAEGTLPVGLGTYAVLPSTVEENLARFSRLGQSCFLGLHGDFLGLADRVGLCWRFGYTGWKWLEPARPDRANGPADWAKRDIAAGPQPAYRLHILPQRPNLGGELPAWCQRAEGQAPAFADWNDYLAMLRDSVRVEKARYPHQKPRLYGGAWEINLNMPPYVSQQPEFRPEQVAELFRRQREVIKAEDPDGWVLGPCPSVLNMTWYETVFRAGVLKYLDGIETHAYIENAFDPEQNDYPGRLARLRALMRQYNGGRELPIYVTEAGQPGLVGAQIAQREQAQQVVRMALILKGEGVRVFLPFYGIDYDGQMFGFLFNKDVAPNPWGTQRCSPKPLVNGFAACSLATEGAQPAGRLTDLGDGVWAYRFTHAKGSTIAVWTTGGSRQVTLPAAAGPLRRMDFVGHLQPLTATAGQVKLTADPWPSYLVAGELP